MGNPWIAFLVVPLVKIVVILLVVILMAAYLSYFERKILAYMQIRIGPNRVGPRGWLQPIADALKLFVKEDIIPSRAEKFVYIIAPALITACIWLRKLSYTCSASVSPKGFRIRPLGPHEAATQALSPTARRTAATPLSLMAAALSARP